MGDHFATVERPKDSYGVYLDGEKIAESDSVILLSEFKGGKAFEPVVYFPMECLDSAKLVKTKHTTFCPIKGTAIHWSYGDIENAIWSYEDPIEGVGDIKGYVGFYLKKGFEIKN